jgi:hypothetical protein
MPITTAFRPIQMSDFHAGIHLDEVDEAHQIRSRLATLIEMERHLAVISNGVQKLAQVRSGLNPSCKSEILNFGPKN